MTNWMFWGGIIIGFLVARHFIGPIVAKGFVKDTNTIIQRDPKLAAQIRSELTRQHQLQQARQTGFNV